MATEQARKRVNRVKVDPHRTFGLEIECTAPISRYDVAHALNVAGVMAEEEGYNHRVVDWWKVTTDASVLAPYGSHTVPMELVSPKLQGKKGLRELKTVLQVLNDIGAQVNNTCGLHVHHDASDLGTITLKDMVKYYAKYEKVISGYMAPIRRGSNNGYCKELRHSVLPGSLREAFRKIDSLYDRDAIEYAWFDRQVTLNLQCIDYRGTVEFRHHDATLDYAEVVYWVALTQTIVESAKAGKFHHISANASTDSKRMFRMAGVQPVVRWHFEEQRERHADDDPYDTYFIDGSEYGELEEEEDEYDEPYDDYDRVEVTWDDEGGEGIWVTGENGLSFLVGCNCESCTEAREFRGQ